MSESIEKIVENCFHPKAGRPNLHKVSVNTKHIEEHMEKAHSNLQAMTLMFDNDHAESLDKAQENRVIEQYGVEVVTNDDAQWMIEDAKDFVLKIEEIIG